MFQRQEMIKQGRELRRRLSRLQKAYDTLPPVADMRYTIKLQGSGPIPVAKNNAHGFIWRKTGTATYPITITSENCYAVLTRIAEDTMPMIRFREANYINISKIHFYKGIGASIYFDNTDFSSVRSCKFSGDGFDTLGGATILIGGNPYATGYRRSSSNIIADNLFFNQSINAHDTTKHKKQAIYLADWAEYNTIFNNTIFDPPSYGIHFWHDDYKNNRAICNILTQNVGNGIGNRGLAIGTIAPGECCDPNRVPPK